MHIRVALASGWRRGLCALLCLLLVGPWLVRCLREYIAASAADKQDLASLRQAVALEPDEAVYQFRLGEYLLLAGQDAADAVPHLQAATRLDRHSAHYWLALARALVVDGQVNAAEQSTDRAVALDPTTPSVLQEAGNLYLAEGSRQKALRAYGAATQMLGDNDPTRRSEILQLSWRASGNVEEWMASSVPATADAYLRVVAFFCNQGDLDNAAVAWRRLLALRQHFDRKAGIAYAGKLIASGRIEQAEQAWSELATAAAPFPYARPADNLIIDGGFEEPVLNDGFGWRYQPPGDNVSLQFDTEHNHGGRHSLLVRFSGEPVATVGLTQLVPVQPNTAYHFAAWVKPALQTASGLRWRIVDLASGQFAQTEDVRGTSDWQQVETDFTSSTHTRLVQLMMVRDPAQPLIRGEIRIDDLRLSQR